MLSSYAADVDGNPSARIMQCCVCLFVERGSKVNDYSVMPGQK